MRTNHRPKYANIDTHQYLYSVAQTTTDTLAALINAAFEGIYPKYFALRPFGQVINGPVDVFESQLDINDEELSSYVTRSFILHLTKHVNRWADEQRELDIVLDNLKFNLNALVAPDKHAMRLDDIRNDYEDHYPRVTNFYGALIRHLNQELDEPMNCSENWYARHEQASS